MSQIHLLPATTNLSLDHILAALDDQTGAEEVLVADAYVEGSESWEAVGWGWRMRTHDGVVVHNVDHHAPVARMERYVSSGNLASVYVRENGVPERGRILINHCDCDSVIAAAILAGLTEPSALLDAAVITADHTGEQDEIADALQALEPLRNLALSLETLQCLLTGRPVPLEPPIRLRGETCRLWGDRIRSGLAVEWVGKVALLQDSERIPLEFVAPLLPEAELILSTEPLAVGRWVVKLRLGAAAQGRFTLRDLNLREFDPAFGGRWNAGSNKRGGGTQRSPHAYAACLADTVSRLSAIPLGQPPAHLQEGRA